MFFALTLPLLSLLSSASAQTLFLVGDSTMALGGGGSGTQGNLQATLLNGNLEKSTHLLGWGVPLAQFFTIPVVNDAVGGESARSYSNEGRFTSVINAAKSGDFVIIEFGHNDATSGAVDNGKQDAVGDGYDITSTVTAAKYVHDI